MEDVRVGSTSIWSSYERFNVEDRVEADADDDAEDDVVVYVA